MKRLFDINVDLDMRLFYVIAWTAIIANTIGYVSNAFLYGLTSETLFTFVCALILYIAGAYGMLKNTHKPVILILIIVNFIEFPFLYCTYGPTRLGYMILGIVGTAMFLGRRWRTIGAGIVVLFDVAVIILQKLFPSVIPLSDDADNLIAVLITFVIAAMSIVFMIIILLAQYEKQQEQLKELTMELQRMAHRDPLTGLFNRRYLTDYIDVKMKNNDEFAVALLDIDDFKSVNDNYGHIYGDEVLQIFAEIMMSYMDGHGIATRFGGEEFMLVFDCATQASMDEIFSRITMDFGRFGMESRGISLSFSGGVEVFHNEDRITRLFNAADEKLYHAKHTGKKRVIYDL